MHSRVLLTTTLFAMLFGMRTVAHGDSGDTGDTGAAVADPCIPASGIVAINELFPGPAPDAGEWLELYGTTNDDLSIDGWSLIADDPVPRVLHTFAAGTLVPGNGHLVIGDATAGNADIVTTLDLPDGGTAAVAIRLVTDNGDPVDSLLFGTSNNDALLDDGCEVADNLAPDPSPDSVLARRWDGKDTNRSGDDFTLISDPTDASPGSVNPAVPPNSGCMPHLGGVVINEMLPNPAGIDTDNEWLELYNSSIHHISVEAWAIETRTSTTWSTAHSFPTLEMAPGAYLLVGGSNVANTDSTEDLGLPNGTHGDGVRLVDCENTPVDTVVYGDDNDDAIPDDSGTVATAWADKPSDDTALARREDGLDTDDSSLDFHLTLDSTPGTQNPVVPVPVCEPHLGGIVINEFVVNPSGSDSGFEWLELHNNEPTPAWVEAWTVQTASSDDAYTTKITLPAVEVPAQGFLVIGESEVPEAEVVGSLTMPNGTNGDGLRLVDCIGLVVDTVVYGSSNDDLLTDDNGTLATSWAPKPGDDEALARIEDGLDTDESGIDFVAHPDGGTPGQDNPVISPIVCTPTVAAVVINEFVANPDGTDVGYEWVELYNKGPGTAQLDEWRLEAGNSPDGIDVIVSLPVGTELAEGAFLVIGESEITVADHTGTLNLGNGTNGDVVRLVDCEGTVIDTVVYGDSNDDQMVDDVGSIAASWASKPGNDESLARREDGIDTDQSGDDFILDVAPTIGATNPVRPLPTCVPSVGGVVINELLANPTGTDAGLEWIEIVNTSASNVSLELWSIEAGTTPENYGARITFDYGAMIEAGEHLLIGEATVSDTDFEASLTMGNSHDGVRLVDCMGVVVDTVIYGDDNADLFFDDNQALASSLAPSQSDGEAIARRDDGVDTNLSAIDFTLTDTPTPGAPNPFIAPPECESNDNRVTVNELLVNPSGADGDANAEWIELYNSSDTAIRLDDWTLGYATRGDDYGIENTETTKHTFLVGTEIPAGGFLVLGEALVAADIEIATFSLPNGTGGDAVWLRDCPGDLADQVLYGGTNDDGLINEQGDIADRVAGAPGEDECLARIQDGWDKDDSAWDFVITTSCTLGTSNPVHPPIECTPSAGFITLNEVLTNPEGDDPGFEWIELYNHSPDAVSVAGWSITTATTSEKPYSEIDGTIPGESFVPGMGFLVIGGSSLDFIDVAVSLDLPNGTNGDGIRLLDCEGNKVDTVVYGSDNDDLVPGDDDLAVDLPIGNPGAGESIARKQDGIDSDSMHDDWFVDIGPSPGMTNIVTFSDEPNDEPSTGCSSKPGQARTSGSARTGCSTLPTGWSLAGGWCVFVLLLQRRRIPWFSRTPHVHR